MTIYICRERERQREILIKRWGIELLYTSNVLIHLAHNCVDIPMYSMQRKRQKCIVVFYGSYIYIYISKYILFSYKEKFLLILELHESINIYHHSNHTRIMKEQIGKLTIHFIYYIRHINKDFPWSTNTSYSSC